MAFIGLHTKRRTSGSIVTFTPEAAGPVIGFASITGKVDPPKVSIDTIQCATPELRNKVYYYVDQHTAKPPHLFRLRKMLDDMPDGELFLLLPMPPSSTAEKFRYEQVLHRLNHSQEQPLDEHLQVFGRLLD